MAGCSTGVNGEQLEDAGCSVSKPMSAEDLRQRLAKAAALLDRDEIESLVLEAEIRLSIATMNEAFRCLRATRANLATALTAKGIAKDDGVIPNGVERVAGKAIGQ